MYFFIISNCTVNLSRFLKPTCIFFPIKLSHAHSVCFAAQYSTCTPEVNETRVFIFCESFFPLTFLWSWICESHTLIESRITRDIDSNVSADGRQRHSQNLTKSSIGMLNIAVFICQYGAPRDESRRRQWAFSRGHYNHLTWVHEEESVHLTVVLRGYESHQLGSWSLVETKRNHTRRDVFGVRNNVSSREEKPLQRPSSCRLQFG